MLEFLNIRSIATIDQNMISFGPALTVVTGETGAGKSLFVDAIDFISGGKPKGLSIRPGHNEGVVEAGFSPLGIIPEFMKDIVSENEDIVIRRVLLENGRTRQTVNGHSVSAGQLLEVGRLLLDIVGQGESFRLLDARLNRKILDVFSEAESLVEDYEVLRSKRKLLLAELDRLSEIEGRLLAEKDSMMEKFDDRTLLSPVEGEWAALSDLLSAHQHAKELETCVGNIIDTVYDGDVSVLGQLRHLEAELNRLTEYDSRLIGIHKLLAESMTILRELSGDARSYLENLEFDPQEALRVETRFDLYQRLSRKYRVDPQQLWSFFSDITLPPSDEIEAQLATTRSEIGTVEDELFVLSGLIREKRIEGARKLEPMMKDRLTKLKLENAVFIVDRMDLPQGDFPPGGADSVRFLFSANPGIPPKPLDEVASGGEVSRLLLVLKWILSDRDAGSTLIFDEVDSGIGGEVGEVLGDLLSEIAQHRQVVTITHLHQVARKGNAHLLVQKNLVGDIVQSSVREIEGEVRVGEIARMLGGDAMSPSTRLLARELLQDRLG
ncbi:DNA repair protein RecN [Leptospirillum ferrooxidans]|uniref:DNA repair protein RecN n=1 Tax=Leptospirillum ferrooxidans (strain C2-3) TaxID=1162668 RepID=I0IPK0_LEPFC|nr:DNA repair protein RecN [Leptospirillum ferrooxidans]BAM07199.1 putative DNA repair protein [Leptospirillum ferrooxidans C2-3]